MREICTSGLMRGSNGTGDNRPLLSTLLVLVFPSFADLPAEASAQAGRILYVDDDAPIDGDGVSWATAHKYLQDAIAEANPAGTGDRELSFELHNGITVKGGYAGLTSVDPNNRDVQLYETILSGDLAGDDEPLSDADLRTNLFTLNLDDVARSDNSVNVLRVTSPEEVVLDGLTITGAASTTLWNGSGLYVEGGPIVVSDCNFVGNIGYIRGGGINSYASSLTALRCRFVRNWAYEGGGIANRGGLFRLEQCTFYKNVVCYPCADTGFGGGFYCDGSPIAGSIIKDCLFIENISTEGGGVSLGIFSHLIPGPPPLSRSAQAQMIGCKFTGNRASRGGAILVNLSSLDVVDCEFQSNSAEYGGSISIPYSEMNVKNSLFCGNQASLEGGCLSASGETATGRGGEPISWSFRLTLDNCTLVDNSSLTGGAITSVSRGTASQDLISVSNCILDNVGPDIYNPDGSQLLVAFTNMRGGKASIYDPCNVVAWEEGNIDIDPIFANPGYWDANDTPDDPNDDFWIKGDYHLKSQAGRWDPDSQIWIQDGVTSPCIDAGDPNSPIGLELFPNGGRINMGAYGGTVEASKSYFGEPICDTIIAGDINGDCRVDFEDLKILVDHWLE